jgi:DGQHR domain-containing protein
MTLKEIIERIKQNNQHTPQEVEVATLLFNLGLKFIFSNKKIIENKQEIGEVDLCFLDELEGVLFVIEVSKQNKKTSQKVDHFFSKWSDKNNLKVLFSKYSLTPRKTIKINFDLYPRDEKVDIANKRSLEHIINEENVLIGISDFKYFSKTFSIIDKWAKNDFYNYLNINSNSGFTEIDAIAFKTGNERAYVFADKVSNILRYSYISRRRDNENGYQRMVEQGRIGSILKTIKRGKTITFPNSIILNSNAVLSHKKIDEDEVPQVVKIKIPKGYCSYRVIDGQHRLMGFAKMGDLNRNDYSLPVVILENLNKSKEIQTFIEINHKQKKLDSNLILSLKADFNWDINDKEYFEKISVLIARELNKNSELSGNIYFGYADEKKGDKVTVTTLHSAIKKNNLTGLNKHLFQTDNTDYKEPYNRIKNLLSTVSKVFPKNKHFFFTNTGIRILFRYVQILERNNLKGLIEKTLEENFNDLISSFKSESLFETIKEQYGEGGANKAVEILCEKLKESNLEYISFEFDLRKL